MGLGEGIIYLNDEESIHLPVCEDAAVLLPHLSDPKNAGDSFQVLIFDPKQHLSRFPPRCVVMLQV